MSEELKSGALLHKAVGELLVVIEKIVTDHGLPEIESEGWCGVSDGLHWRALVDEALLWEFVPEDHSNFDDHLEEWVEEAVEYFKKRRAVAQINKLLEKNGLCVDDLG